MSALVVSPDVIIRFKQGKLYVHASDPSRAMTAERPDIVSLLVLFARPADPAGIVAAYPAEVRPRIDEVIRKLVEHGLLIDAQAAHVEADARTALDRLGDLATAVHEVSTDLLGFGPAAERLLNAEGRDVGSRIGAALAAIDSLATDLRAVKDRYVEEQLQALGRSRTDRNLRINIGAGERRLEGWVNVDVFPAELAVNVKWGLPFADGAADFVYSSHFLEHLYYPRETLGVLAEILRVLAPGGRLRLAVPDIGKCLRAYVAGDHAFFTRRRETWDWWPEDMTPLEDALLYAGVGPDPLRLFESHKFGFDLQTLQRLLERAGFADITPSAYMASAHAELRVDDASLVAGASYREDQHYSLFVEASRR